MRLRAITILIASMLSIGCGPRTQAIVSPAWYTASVDDSLFDALVAARNRNQVVRLFLDDELVTGRVQAIDRTALLIQRRSVRWEEMDSAQVRFVIEDPVWNGALIGAGATAGVLTVFVGAMARGIGGRALTGREALGVFTGGAVIGGAVGIGFDGALVGPASWRTVWSREQASAIDER